MTSAFTSAVRGTPAIRAMTVARRSLGIDPTLKANMLLQPSKGMPASEVRAQIRRICSRYASVVRTEEGLREGLMELKELRKMGVKPDGMGLAFALETVNMLDVAEAILTAALHRKESRGCHLFFEKEGDLEPMPKDDAKFRRYFVLRRKNGKIILEPRVPIHIDWLGGRR